MEGVKGRRRGKEASLDDLLGDLLSDDSPQKQPVLQYSSKAKGGKASVKDDDFYSNLAAMADDHVDSDVSEADVNQVAKAIADLDDMDADLFGGSSKKNGGKSRSGKPTTPRRSSLTPRSRSGTPRSGKPGSPRRSGDSSPPSKRPPQQSVSSPAPADYKPGTAPGKMTDLGKESENLKPGQTSRVDERPQTVPKAKPKLDFGEFDEDDPLAGLLSDEDSEVEKKAPSMKPALRNQLSSEDVVSATEPAVITTTNSQTKPSTSVASNSSLFDRPPTRSGGDINSTEQNEDIKPKSAPPPAVKKKEDRLFSDDEDMLDGLGIEDKPKPSVSMSTKDEEVRPARSALDSLLGKDTVNKHLQKTERREFVIDKKPVEKDDGDEDDFVFGDYKPSSVSGSRPTSRRSVRFQDDDIFGTDDKPPSRGRSDPGKSKPPDDMDWLELASGNRSSIDVPKVKEKKELTFNTKSSPSDWLGLKASDSDGEDDDLFPSSTLSQSKTTGRKTSNDDWLEKLKVMNHGSEEKEPAVEKAEVLVSPPPSSNGKEDKDDYLGLGKEINLDELISSKPESPTFPGKKSVADDGVFKTPNKPEDSVDASFRRRRILLDDDDDIFPSRESEAPPPRSNDQSDIFSKPDFDLDLDPNPYFKKPQKTVPTRHTQPQSEGPVIQTAVYASRDPQIQNLRNMSNNQPSASLSNTPLIQPAQPSNTIAYPEPSPVSFHRPQVQNVPQPIPQSSPLPLQLPNSLPEAHAMLHKLAMEKQYIESLLDGTKRRYEEEISAVEMSFRNRMRILEESNQKKESRLREETEQLMEQHLMRIRQMEEEKADLANQNYRKLEELERQKAKDAENLKEQNRLTLSEMKREHEEAIERLKEAKNREIDAVASANDTSRSLTAVVEQIQSSTKDLGSLQSQVESIHRSGLDEREISLKAKDAQLQNLQERLSRQEEDNERERKRLEDLIARMETQLKEQTRLLDEERWKMKGEMSRLEASQRALEEEKRIWLETQSREKQAIDRSRDNFQEENRMSLSQLNNERRALAEERMKWNVDLKLQREQAHQEAIKKAQTEAEYEVLTKTIAEEKSRATTRRQELRHEEDRINTERARLEREKYNMDMEKESLEKMALQLKTKSAEIDSLTEMANKTQMEGDKALMEARNIEVQQNERLINIKQQQQQLKVMEETVTEDKLRLAKERLEIENITNASLCVSCRNFNGGVQPNMGQMANQSQMLVPSTGGPGRFSSVMPNGVGGPVSVNTIETIASSIAADRSIRMWKIQALKDRDYLEEESMFLQTLKHSPYHGNNHSFH